MNCFPEHQVLLLKSLGNTSQSDKEKHEGLVTLGEAVKRELAGQRQRGHPDLRVVLVLLK